MRSVARWAAGVVLLWGSFAMLWMPWADYQKSYRSVALQLRSKIPVDAGCIAQRSLGISQAAALDYHAGIRRTAFRHAEARCLRAASRAGQPEGRVRRPRPGLGQARRRRPAGRPVASAIAFTGWRRSEHHFADRVPRLDQAFPPRRELARRADQGSVRERRGAEHPVRRRGAGPALRLLAPAPRRRDAAPARQPRRRARLAGVARGAAFRQAGQHEREARRVAHGAARGR